MKIGVAFSGSGPGAAYADVFAKELQEAGVKISMISASSLSAVPLLLCSRNEKASHLETSMRELRAGYSVNEALINLKIPPPNINPDYNMAINCVDEVTGTIVIYSDSLKSNAWNLKVRPLIGNEREAFLATLNPWQGLAEYHLGDMHLCDFSVRYGSPLFALKMGGMERLLSVSFAGGILPAQLAADSLSVLMGKNADLHFTIRLTSEAQIENSLKEFIHEHTKEIYEKLLF